MAGGHRLRGALAGQHDGTLGRVTTGCQSQNERTVNGLEITCE